SDPGKMDRDLEALGIAFGHEVAACDLDKGMLCCGYPLYADGQMDVLSEHMKRLGEQLMGHDVVVTPDPGCAYTLSVVRRALLGDVSEKPSLVRERKAKKQQPWPDVVPLVEVLAQRASRFRGR